MVSGSISLFCSNLAGRVLLLVTIDTGSGGCGWVMESSLQLRRYRRSRRLGVAIAALLGRGRRGLLRFRRMVALGAFADLDVCRMVEGHRAIWRRKNHARRRLRLSKRKRGHHQDKYAQ